jgi:DNA-binding MarR family transcriptional regulator
LLQRDLIKQMASDPNTIASLVDRMQKAGLLERETHDKDRRANLLRLLPVGEAKYQEARKVALALQAEVLSSVPEQRREAFLEELERVAENCRVAADKS